MPDADADSSEGGDGAPATLSPHDDCYRPCSVSVEAAVDISCCHRLSASVSGCWHAFGALQVVEKSNLCQITAKVRCVGFLSWCWYLLPVPSTHDQESHDRITAQPENLSGSLEDQPSSGV